MALVDIVTGEIKTLGIHTSGLKGTQKRIKDGKGPTDSGDYNQGLIALILEYNKEKEEVIAPDEYLVVEKTTPEIRIEMMTEGLTPAYETARDRLVEQVEPVSNEILGNLEGDVVLSLVLGTPAPEEKEDEFEEERKLKREYSKWSDKYEEKDANFYLENSHKLVRKILEKEREDLEEGRKNDNILGYMEQRVGYHETEVIRKFADIEKFAEAQKNKDEKGIDASVDTDKSRKYLGTVITEFTPEAKRDAYESIGMIYSDHLIKQERDARNEKTKEHLDSAA